jgi:hypothetical protein
MTINLLTDVSVVQLLLVSLLGVVCALRLYTVCDGFKPRTKFGWSKYREHRE